MLRQNPTEILPAKTTQMTSGSALDALPKQFVNSMKTLFDILDDQHTGFVRFSDIQKGWQDDGSKGLPRGVIDSLRKVTPASGYLCFERFCAGLKLCLLRNQNEILQKPLTKPTQNVRSPSAPIDVDHVRNFTKPSWNNNINSTTHKKLHAQRALSMPQLSPNSDIEAELVTVSSPPATVNIYNSPPPPPKPPRAAATAAAAASAISKSSSVGLMTANVDKAEIRNALQNWQMGILMNEMEAKEVQKRGANYAGYRGSADGGSSSATDSGPAVTDAIVMKKSNTKRREPRRHTLQNGIDYNLLKRRLKQFEEEREVLLLGLEAVEKARDWYAQQLNNVQEKIKYLGRMGTHVEQWSEVQQERLNFQRARVLEINRNLQTLTDTWERGVFPMHFNLAIRTPNTKTISGTNNRHTLNVAANDRLRQQNRLLANEINFKSDRISLLEREKQNLLQELYEMQKCTPHIRGPTAAVNYLGVLSQASPGCSSSSGALGDADVVY